MKARSLPNLDEQERQMYRPTIRQSRPKGAKGDHCRVPGLLWITPTSQKAVVREELNRGKVSA